jgi:hypothetical protein
MAAVTNHPKGDTAEDPKVGDFLLTGIRAQGVVSWAIQAGSWLRRYEAPYLRFSHTICSVFVSDALTRAGYVWPRPPFAMMPADLALYFDVRAARGPR